MDLKEISNDVIAEAVRFTSFENMRKMESADKFKSARLRPLDKEDKESYKTRRGKVGGFVDYLSRENIEYINRKINEELSSLYKYRP